MKVLISHVLLVFGAQQQQAKSSSGGSSGFLDKFSFLSPLQQTNKNDKTRIDELRNEKVQDLLQVVKQVGQVGSLATPEEQKRVEELAAAVIPLSESKSPAKFPLMGEHKLVYSAAPGASSGRVFGNVVGKVTQFFKDDEVFYNRVALGPLQIALQATRKIVNESTIQVSFLETTFSLFGQTVKTGKTGGGGVWKVKFVGTVVDAADSNKRKLVRIMETPSLFILEQTLE
jgi:hypothetical protein